MRTIVALCSLTIFGMAMADDLYVCKQGDKRVVSSAPCPSSSVTTSSVAVEPPATAAEKARQAERTQRALNDLSLRNSQEAYRLEREDRERQEAYSKAQQQQIEAQQRQQIINQNDQIQRQQAAALAAAQDAAAQAERAAASAQAAANNQKKHRPMDCKNNGGGWSTCY